MRAFVEKPIRRVEIRVAGRSNVPRWGKTKLNDGKNGGLEAPHGSSEAPTVVNPFMDFSQLKETLLNNMGADIPLEDLGQKITWDPLTDLNSPPLILEPVEIHEDLTFLQESSSVQKSSRIRGGA
jgi:hypothetical protein